MAGVWSCTVGLGVTVSLLGLLLSVALAVELPIASTFSNFKQGANVKSRSYLSAPFTLKPGEVSNKVREMEFPTGHIAVKGFDAELVDEAGVSVPLTDVYLHHWVVARYYVDEAGKKIHLRNDGICQDRALDQLFGLGSETRHTNYAIPDPYGIVVGDPALVPEGNREAWSLNIHGIDTRSAVDPHGCLECRCKLYGVDVTTFEYADEVGANYTGGLYCCEDGQRCAVSGPSLPPEKTYYLKYTIHYVDWNPTVVPLRTYIFDVTDNGKRGGKKPYGCRVEYEVPACDRSLNSATCVHTAETTLPIPKGGHVIYSVAHQHVGGMGCTVYGEDDRELCTSEPMYGTGSEAGNEAGYVVGMGACYPKPGSVKVYDEEKLRLRCRYSSLAHHTGVMSLHYILVADFEESESGNQLLRTTNQLSESQNALVSAYVTTIFGLAGVVAACGVIVVALVLVKRRQQLDAYALLR